MGEGTGEGTGEGAGEGVGEGAGEGVGEGAGEGVGEGGSGLSTREALGRLHDDISAALQLYHKEEAQR